jgi:hypothetical protein
MLTTDTLHERLNAIAHSLSQRPDALALLGLGASGKEIARLDRWSDLDFFVLVREGAKRRYIDSLDWLAAAHPLIWHYQNTADGHKAVMQDGVFCEFAIFEIHELVRIPFAPGRFIWQREEVDDSLAVPHVSLPAAGDTTTIANEALGNVLIGLQRAARGERLAALRMIQVYALDGVLELIDRANATRGDKQSIDVMAARDPFSVVRRFERRHPKMTHALPALAGGYEAIGVSALALLALLEQYAEVPTAMARRIRQLANEIDSRHDGENHQVNT